MQNKRTGWVTTVGLGCVVRDLTCLQQFYDKLVIKERKFPRKCLGMYKTVMMISYWDTGEKMFASFPGLRSMNSVKSCAFYCVFCWPQRAEGFGWWKRLLITKLNLPAVKITWPGQVLVRVAHLPIPVKLLEQNSPLFSFNLHVFSLKNTSSQIETVLCFLCMSGSSTW